MEFGAVNRLASASRAGDFSRTLVIWDELIRRHWPGGSSFLSQVTERVGSPLTAPDQLRRWLDHLEKAHAALSADPLGGPALAVVAVERKRVQSKLGQ